MKTGENTETFQIQHGCHNRDSGTHAPPENAGIANTGYLHAAWKNTDRGLKCRSYNQELSIHLIRTRPSSQITKEIMVSSK